jgi:MoxR-like ATPase
MAMERGARLVIEEIEKTSDELLSHLLHVCDESQSRIVLPDETIVTPREGFHVVATSNVEDISELPESLLDRFTIRIVVTELHPDAIASLPEDLRNIASRLSTIEDEGRKFSLRALRAFGRTRNVHGEDLASRLVFSDKATDFLCALKLSNEKNQKA